MKNKKSKSAAAATGGPPTPTNSVTVDNADNKLWKDPRFAHLVGDPRFKNISQSTRSVKIDKRFQGMFNDDKFNVKYTVDKRGRPIKKSTADDLKKYYELDSSDEENVAEEQRKELEAIGRDDDDDEKVVARKGKAKKEKKTKLAKEDDATDDEGDVAGQLGSDDDASAIPVTLKDKLKDLTVDYARGESALCSDEEDSSDDESSDDEDGDGKELFIEHVWGELDTDAPRTEESTRRLAVCNMDWDRIRAADIMVLCNSFLPPGGAILSVTIYPSEFGKERMAAEELKGPQELTEAKLSAPDSDDEADSDDADSELGEPKSAGVDKDAEEGDDYNMEKLRQYQLNRLKYYYAVIECNSVSAADKIYAECDGMEYESTATKLDLRFIPDDMDFDESEPKEVCREMPDTSKYMPRLFTTTALQQAKVELTWDENDLERKELNDKLAAGKLSEIGDQELRKYVAYSSEEEEEEDETEVERKKAERAKKSSKKSKKDEKSVEEEKPIKKSDSLSKYKALLAEINEKETEKKNNRIEMEFSWGIGMKDKKSIDKPTAGDSDLSGGSDNDGDNSDDDGNDSTEEVANKNSNKSLAVKPKANPEMTHFERIVELKREKKKARKEEQKLKRRKYRNGGGIDDSGSEIGDDDSDVPDGIDMNDPYFAEEFANGEFEAPKVSSKRKKLLEARKKRRNGDDDDSEAEREKAELALLLDDGDDGEEQKAHFSLKKIQDGENETKSKRKRKAVLKRSKKQNVAEKEMLHADDFKIDTTDDRFAAIYTSHQFSIDPTHPNFKKTKAMDALIAEKLKRQPEGGKKKQANGVAVEIGASASGENVVEMVVGDGEPELKKPKRNVETSMLVKSIKRKVQQQQQQKK